MEWINLLASYTKKDARKERRKFLLAKCERDGIEYKECIIEGTQTKGFFIMDCDMPKFERHPTHTIPSEILGKPIEQHLAEYGLSVEAIKERLSSGWSFNEAYFTPKGGLTESCMRRASIKNQKKDIYAGRKKKYCL